MSTVRNLMSALEHHRLNLEVKLNGSFQRPLRGNRNLPWDVKTRLNTNDIIPYFIFNTVK